ncbi:hypothetical protein DB347_19850 [Opitutaceae bacterium EW11]|nr:hypothetical protein DB347_19850 [Opitutaceae bacterium EW11]
MPVVQRLLLFVACIVSLVWLGCGNLGSRTLPFRGRILKVSNVPGEHHTLQGGYTPLTCIEVLLTQQTATGRPRIVRVMFLDSAAAPSRGRAGDTVSFNVRGALPADNTVWPEQLTDYRVLSGGADI